MKVNILTTDLLVIEQKDNSDDSKMNIKFEKNMDNFNIKDDKLVRFINGVNNYSSFATSENESIYLLDKNRSKYKWINNTIKNNFNYPISIQGVKIVNICANYNSCYMIGEDGNLYEKNKIRIKKHLPPENTKKFLNCVCELESIICIAQNKEGKGILFKGINSTYHLGLIGNNYNLISKFTKINIDDNLDFKQICTFQGDAAALTSCGKLYIWGSSFRTNYGITSNKIYHLVNKNELNNEIIIDKIFLNNECLYAIGRQLNNENYITKLYALTSDFNLEEFNLDNKKDKNSGIIPINIIIGKERTYFLCIDENEMLNEIEKIDEINKEIQNKVTLLINYDIKRQNEENIEPSIDEMKKIYNSENLDKFMELFNSLSEKNIKDLRDTFDEMNKGEIETKNIEYDELIEFTFIFFK